MTAPRHFRRAVTQILMQPNVVVEKRELANSLFESIFAVDLNVSNRALEGSKKAFDAAIHPRRMWIASLMFDAQSLHRQRKESRYQSAIIIRPKRFRFSKRFNQSIQHSQNHICASVHETQRQQSSAAVINHTKQCVGFRAYGHMCPIQSPSLIGFAWSGWFPQYFAQLRNFITRFFAQLCHIGFADRLTTKGKAGVEHGCDGSAANVAARHGKQAQHFGLHPAGFALFACAIALSLSLSQGLAAGEWMRSPVLAGQLDARAPDAIASVAQNQDQNHQQNQEFERAAEGDWHGALAWLDEFASVASDEKHEQSLQQNTAIQPCHGLLLEQVSKTERIWLWARVGTLCSPVGKTYTQSWVYKLPEVFTDKPFIKDRVATSSDNRSISDTYSYDARGNLTGHQRGSLSESWTVAMNGDITGHTDYRNNAMTQSFDEYGLPKLTVDALGGRVDQRFDARGRLLSTSDQNQHSESYQYDQRDRRILTTYADRTTLAIAYSDTLNTQTSTDALERKTISAFDLMGRLLKTTDANNRSMTYVPDKNGNVTRMTDYRGNVTEQTFNGANFITDKVEPEGKVSAYVVDGLGHVTRETVSGVGGSRTTTREYQHPSYQVTSETREGSSAGALQVRFEYDGNGNKIKQIDARSNATSMTYDDFDRVLTTTEPLSKLTTLTRDANGNVLTQTRTRGGVYGNQVRSMAYDSLNRVTSSTDATGAVTRMDYDAVGNLLSTTNARNATLRSSFDSRNRKLSDSGPEAGMSTTYAYDLMGNVKIETHGNGQAITHEYDRLNRRTLSTDGIGTINMQGYDENGNVTSSRLLIFYPKHIVSYLIIVYNSSLL